MIRLDDELKLRKERATVRSKPREQRVVGREWSGVSNVRTVAQSGRGEPQHVKSGDPRSPLFSVQDELLHSRDDGRQVRGAEGFAADLAVYGTAVARVDEDGTVTHVPLKDVQL